ncbi:MAG: flavin reductase family protein [Firmicutes bacterium]|nr:flavin reductase family protein [Bacillota bacterium]
MFFDADMARAMSSFTAKGAFLTVRGGGKVNTMTISWGFIGVIWDKPHFVALVRPQRYTYGLMEKADCFTVSIPDEGDLAEELVVCGTRSGADIDKSKVVGFVPAKAVDGCVVAGCRKYLECRVNYRGRLEEGGLRNGIKETFYDGDYHILFFGEIVSEYEGGDA